MEILKFHAPRFLGLVRHFSFLGSLLTYAPWYLPKRRTNQVRTVLPLMREECARLDLLMCLQNIDELQGRLDRDGRIDRHDLRELQNTLERELNTRVFLSIPSDRRKAFSEPFEGWQHILEVFLDAQEDIEEMNKCYALSRYTAAVFHSLLVVEHGLVELGHRIGVTDPKPGWDATYRRLVSLLDSRDSIPPELDFNFLEQTKARLDSMKLAWRNKVNHAAGRLVIEKTGFSDVSAEEVIIACRSFMRHLAADLHSAR